MNYPLISEYIEAIRAAEENFDQLKHLRPVLDDDGQPVMTSGNFAVVFKMKDEQTEKLHAVKCFLKEQEGRAEAYRLIAEELEYVSSTFLTPIKYLDKELFVDSSNSEVSEFPVLLMDWVEGQTLDKYIRNHIDDEYELSLLAYQFSRLAMWLMPQPFAHGDLKPDNILVKDDGSLVLVDYDGMYVPAMKGQKARELGSPDFRHPSRTEDVFEEHIDDFSLVSILLSLKAIALQPELLGQYGVSDRLLFSENDYRNLSESQVMDVLKSMIQDTELATLYSLFILSSAQNNLSQTSFRLLNLRRPIAPKINSLSTEVTEEDFANAWEDEYGVKYSQDRKRLLKAPEFLRKGSIFSYTIREGTRIICNNAFRNSFLWSIIIPEGMEAIGDRAFVDSHLKSLALPQSLKYLGVNPFAYTQIKVSCASKMFAVDNNMVYDKDRKKLISSFFSIEKILLPLTLTHICTSAFSGCDRLKEISLPNKLESIGSFAFFGCKSLETLTIPSSVKSIGNYLFPKSGINYIKCFSEYFKTDGKALYDKEGNKLIIVCCSIKEFDIPNSVTIIGSGAFMACESLQEIYIPDSVVSIENDAFNDCISLSKISIPDSVRIIGRAAFMGCTSIESMSIPDKVTEIAIGAFYNCSSLKEIRLPRGLNKIGMKAFENCTSLQSILIPFGTKQKFEKLLPENKNKLVESNSYGWIVKATRDFSQDEIAAVKRAEVVSSQYGYSVCFFMVAGGQTYIPLVNYSTLSVGDTVDLSNAKLLTLSREGDDDIYRVDA